MNDGHEHTEVVTQGCVSFQLFTDGKKTCPAFIFVHYFSDKLSLLIHKFGPRCRLTLTYGLQVTPSYRSHPRTSMKRFLKIHF